MLSNAPSLEEKFLENGKKFYELAMKSKNRYMQYTGAINAANWGLGRQTKCNGRVMIDFTSFASVNPSYSMGEGRPLPTRPSPTHPAPTRPSRYSSEYDYVSDPGDYDEDYARGYDGSYGEDDVVGGIDLNSEAEDGQPSDATLIFAPAIVYGFSFELKEWGSFAVSGFSEISFNTGAFDVVEMDAETKLLIESLVGQYIGRPADRDQSALTGETRHRRRVRVDPITRKGEGCLFLCYGPPRTGKTLTAESIAEKRRNLWSLSVSELGTSSEALEKRLVQILEIAARWHAVLLLDEADVYLEKRAASEIERNAMTGVFLRLLEYYRGVLFLTSNRIDTFDDAFRSRISLFVHYPPLTVERKAKIWHTMLRKVNVEGLSVDFCEQMASHDINGREIRNAINMAQVWANSKGEVLEVGHVDYVTRVLAKSIKTLTNSKEQ